MSGGRRRDEWQRWASWFAIYGAAHGVERSPNFYMPDEFKVSQPKAEPIGKMTLRQLALAQGHNFGATNGSGSK